MLNIVLLLMGLFLEPLAALILAMPILSAVAPHIGIDPVQFGIMVVLNLMIGMITPPVGLVLFIVSTIARTPLEVISRTILPLIGICIIVLALVAFWAPLSLTLPAIVGH